MPEPFYAIGGFYDDFGQVEDETVIRILENHRADG
jgi:predicted phosphoribosyltransferase